MSADLGVGPVEITVVVDPAGLAGYSDSFLATAWHVAQANPAPFGDRVAGELVERVGREVIRRWLAGVTPELWHHQGHHHYWNQLRQLARYEPAGQAGSADWHRGTWTPRPTGEDPEATEEGEQ